MSVKETAERPPDSPKETVERPPDSPKDVFSMYQQNVDKLFSSIRRTVPQYHQSITNIQQECLQAYEGIIDSTITLQREYAKKTGITTDIPETTLRIIHDTTEEIAKAVSIQNQVTLATMGVAQQNIKTFNDNVKSFVDLNRDILQSWISALTTKNS